MLNHATTARAERSVLGPTFGDRNRQLAWQSREGDAEARHDLIVLNMPLAMHWAAPLIRRFPLRRDDLLSAALLGLTRAADHFDPQRDAEFSTCAAFWIRQAIQQFLVCECSTIRIPRHLQGHAAQYAKFRTPANLALVARARTAVGRGWGGATNAAEDPLRNFAGLTVSGDHQHRHERVASALRFLAPRDRGIVERYWGLDGSLPETCPMIARRLGLTKSRVHQLLMRSMTTVRSRLAEQGIHSVSDL